MEKEQLNQILILIKIQVASRLIQGISATQNSNEERGI